MTLTTISIIVATCIYVAYNAICLTLFGIPESLSNTYYLYKEKSNKALETIKQTEKNLERIRDKEAHDLYFLLRCLRKAPRGWHRRYQVL